MSTQTAPHPTVRPSTGYGFALLLLWLAVWSMLLSSCVSWDAVRQYSQEKGARLIECQLQDPTSTEQARACLGTYARDLGTEGCKEAEAWLETLTTMDDTQAADEAAQLDAPPDTP